ncbi:MAG TPA: hypothetical protein VGL92_15220 [Acidimicrobiia bacterium]
MWTGPVKRATFFIGLTILIIGVLTLIDPISRDEINCGSSVMPRSKKVAIDARAVPEACQAPIRHHRWIGGAAVVFGTVAVRLTGTRCLLAPD